MNRICITINFFPISGGARAIAADVWRTMHNDYEIHFLTIPPPDYSGPYMIHPLQKMRRHFVPCNPGLFPLNLLYMLWGTIKLLELNKNYHFEAILAQDGVFTGLYSAIVGKLTHTRVVIMDYGATTNYLSNAYWNFRSAVGSRGRRTLINLHTLLLRSAAQMAIRMTAKMTERFGVLGYELTEIYHQMDIPDSKMRTIQYGVDENFYKPLEGEKASRRREFGIAPDSVVVNATCRLSQEKGIEYLMPALRQAVEKNGRIVCLVVGTGNMLDFASDFVRRNNLEGKIRLMGDATPKMVRDLLQISDIFIYAGVSGSNISIAVLEAMATQCAVVATNSPKSHEDLLADDRGMAVPIKSSSAIAESIILLSRDAELRKRMGENGRRWVLENHSSKAVKESIELLVTT
jgi:glycosyltransferase involved in cell wall biosynthesis